MKKDNLILALMLAMFTSTTSGQNIVGKWKTIDDRNGNSKAIVELYKQNGRLYGNVLKILEKGKENAKCVKCDGELKDKPVEGMRIIHGFESNEKGEYRGKRLFDPEQGMTFRGRIWLDPNNADQLKVRGYLAFLYRTQTWLRVIE